jgi:hypothetical protein
MFSAHSAVFLPFALAGVLLGEGAAATGEVAPGEGPVGTPSAAQSESAERFEPEGAWYILIHYRDTAAGSPVDTPLWDERIWTFERKGAQLRWTEHPFAIFERRTGRFEELGGARSARTLGFWEPDEAQRAQIDLGLASRMEGSRSKSLRGSREAGYRSTGGIRVQSTSVIGYSEIWSIADLELLPVFSFDARMGSGRTEDMEGRTAYRVTEIEPGGRQLVGRYERDGTRHGTFRMTRMAGLRLWK